MPAPRRGVLLAMLREGLKYVPALATWLAGAFALAALNQGLLAIVVLAVGALCILISNADRPDGARLPQLDRAGSWLTAGAAQAYGAVRAGMQASRT